ncbi:DUF707 domain-containing protein [Paraferrimonas sp. SM1919]|uniref:DUF707 domain-containing protein n=1 Tax=Paraferrimonas sp. SM1919 TaxID=2662263 RepID=UPI001F094334|nr:DUF707 domain-containing protein [Paraferrimonas sp. SM1919]
MKPNKAFLIIARVGDSSLHGQWLQGANPLFDLYLSYYGDTQQRYQQDCQFYEQQKGGKWPILAEIIERDWDVISQYDAVWLPDDDLMADAATINRMFSLFYGLGLQLGQPALTMNSYYSHPSLLQRPQSLVRMTNFVEVMAPVFSASALAQLKHTFSQSKSGWGLDNLWPHLLNNQGIGILDATAVVHTRPVGGELYKNNPELSPQQDKYTLQALYPQFNIKRSRFINKFRVFSQAKLASTSHQLVAFVKGKIQKITAISKAKRHIKFGQ